jgi:hypothetical protein
MAGENSLESFDRVITAKRISVIPDHQSENEP